MNKIYCSNCGKLIPEQSNFCRFCGAAQHGKEAAVYRAEAPIVQHASAPVVQEVQRVTQTQAPGNMKYYRHRHLPRRVIWLFFANYIAKSAAILPLLAIGMFFEPWLFGAITAVYIVVVYMTAVLVHHNFLFTIDENGYKEEYGILHKKHVSLTYEQIQNVNIIRGIVDRLFGLARIYIETAGHAGLSEREVTGGHRTKAEAYLPGITLKDAKKIHDLLLYKVAHADD